MRVVDGRGDQARAVPAVRFDRAITVGSLLVGAFCVTWTVAQLARADERIRLMGDAGAVRCECRCVPEKTP